MQLARFDDEAYPIAMPQSIHEIDEAIHHYILESNRVQELLRSALSSCNGSLFNFLASGSSRSQNYAASAAVNELELLAKDILSRLKIEHETKEKLRMEFIKAETFKTRSRSTAFESDMPSEHGPALSYPSLFMYNLETEFYGEEIEAFENNNEIPNRNERIARVLHRVMRLVYASRDQAIEIFEQRNPRDFRYKYDVVEAPKTHFCKALGCIALVATCLTIMVTCKLALNNE